VPTALLALGIVAAVATAVSLWPPRRPGLAALGAFFIGWLVSELPLHAAAIWVGAAAALSAGGGLAGRTGWIGLALVGLAVLGLIHHVRLATRTTILVERALVDGLGRDYHDRIHAELRDAYDPTTRWHRLALIYPARPREVERIRDVEYGRVSGRPLRLDVYRRAGAPPTRAPVFVYVHGGAWVIGTKGQQGRLTMHELAAAGWIGVSVDYRLSPRATFPDHLLDVKRALAWVKQHVAEYGGDPDFVVVGGGSAGGHLAALAALTPNLPEYQRDVPDVDTRVQGCVAYYGVYDFADRDRTVPYRLFRWFLERVVMKRRLADAPEEFDKASPIARIGAGAPPFMVLQGDRDSLTPAAGAARFVAALRARSRAPVVFVELPGAHHAFEIFPSLRSVPAVHGVHRFCQALYSAHLAGQGGRRAE
jgi:acetyl esterase/lipase